MTDKNENDFYFSSLGEEDKSNGNKPNENKQEYTNIYAKNEDDGKSVSIVAEFSSNDDGSEKTDGKDNFDNFYSNNDLPSDIQKNNKKGMAIASLVLGILSLVCCCCAYMIFPLITAVVGLILGIVAYKNNHSGLALAGIITSAVAICFGLIVMVAVLSGNSAINKFWDAFWEEFERAYESEMKEFTSQSEQLLESVQESLSDTVPEVFSENPFNENFITSFR